MLGNILLARAKSIKEQLSRKYYETTGYKKNQLIAKMYEHDRKWFPHLFWDSKKNGTYRKLNNEKSN